MWNSKYALKYRKYRLWLNNDTYFGICMIYLMIINLYKKQIYIYLEAAEHKHSLIYWEAWEWNLIWRAGVGKQRDVVHKCETNFTALPWNLLSDNSLIPWLTLLLCQHPLFTWARFVERIKVKDKTNQRCLVAFVKLSTVDFSCMNHILTSSRDY